MVDSRDCLATLKNVRPLLGWPWLSSWISCRPCRESAFGRILKAGIPCRPDTLRPANKLAGDTCAISCM